MLIKDVIFQLEQLAPSFYAEDFDNTGLLVGNKNNTLNGILVTLDTLESVVDEAIDRKCNLIVSFHPIIFKGLKKLNGSNYVERTILKAIKNDIAIYAIHTALDNALIGVNDIICKKIGLINTKILIPKSNTLKKLITYAPINAAELIKNKLFEVGAGKLGNYDECSFSTKGTGTYKGNSQSSPYLGQKEKQHKETELMISMTFESHLEHIIIKTLLENHPYEEVAYEVLKLSNKNPYCGMGMIGEFKEALKPEEALSQVKKIMNTNTIKHSKICKDHIKKVAILGGSGSFAIGAAKNKGADLFITSDLKYHDFFQAENSIILADIGHYESEQYTKLFLTEYLSKKFPNFAIVLSTTNTNPVKYF